MDLLTYAVNRKLTHVEDPLLEYVAAGRDVPVSVIESSFEGLLKPLEDERSSLLVEDYSKMLEKYVPIQFTSNVQEGGYEVSGEITEEILEAINLVHGMGQEEVISELISESTSKITSRPVKVGNLSLEELSIQMEDLTNNLSDVESFDVHSQSGEELAYDLAEDDVEEFEESFDDDLTDCLAEEVAEEFAEEFSEEAPETIIDDVVEDVVETVENGVEEFIEEEQEVIEEDLIEAESEDLEELDVEEMTEEELAAVESKMLAEGIKRVYTRLVEDLKAYGLDESLGLSL